MFCGLWVLTGLLVFIIVEKMLSFNKTSEEAEDELVEEKKKSSSFIMPKKLSGEDYILNNNVCSIKDVAYHELTKSCNGVVRPQIVTEQQSTGLTHNEVS